MRFADNHDEQRAIARFGMGGALAAFAMVFTMDGLPLIYNGTEAGDATESGDPALFEKLPVFWPIAERRPEFPRFSRQIIALRRAHPALCQGETEWLHNSDEGRVISYLRKADHEEFLVALNTSNRPFRGTVEVANGPAFQEVTPDIGSSFQHNDPPPPTALPAISLGSWGFRIFQRERPQGPSGSEGLHDLR
jgi:glycosidase